MDLEGQIVEAMRAELKRQAAEGEMAGFTAGAPWRASAPSSWNSPSEIGTATLSSRVNTRNPTAKMAAATRSSARA